MINFEIAKIFEEMSIILEMMNVPFKPRAFEKVALEIAALSEDVKFIYIKNGVRGLRALPGVGKSMAEKIEEYIHTGHVKEYEALKKKFPIHILELKSVQGVGPKMIKELYQELKIKNLADLERAARAQKIRKLPGLGEKTEENILRGIEFLKGSGGRKLLGSILGAARTIEAYLQKIPGVQRAVICGSLRRRKETVGDIDILVSTRDAQKVNEAFIKMDGVVKVCAHGETRSSVHLNTGLDADLRVVPSESFGAALQYFTGDKTHNVHMRKLALQKGWKLNEYGLFSGKKMIAGKTEEEIYAKLGLDYIEPELRTDAGEIEAAKKHTLPRLLPYGSVRGDLQVQTNWTDGSSSIEEMAEAAMALGREYIAITDHTKSLAITDGLDEKKLEKQGKEIENLNKKFKARGKKFQILKGAEVNILKDGSLDITDTALAKLDVVGISVHSLFHMSRQDMTKRILKAIENPYVDILFHPTGRLIGKRPAYEVDMNEVIRAAKKYGVALEVNAFPDRSDLSAEHIRMAVREGVKLVINTDAHAPSHLNFMEWGEALARCGWAEKKDILNTLPLDKLLDVLSR